MLIYRIENDEFKFQELDLEIDDFIENFPDQLDDFYVYDFSRNNLALAEYWPTMITGFSEIDGNENLIPDITCWIGATLLLSPRAFRFLEGVLHPFGEFLPIYIEGERYSIFNCLTIADVVNPESKDDDYVFNKAELQDKLVFKPTKQFSMHVCCTERLKEAVDSFELSGVIFKLIS